ncbi:MAG: NUDIX hydrolase [Candidatus Nealsonbacteria bacterium]|nr:NUDIX hydrolase [Candidatus Nealsonbacteria bacterium]
MTKKWDGRWNLPGGGVDEKDAEKSLTPEQVVAREVKEETGLDVKITDFRPIGEYPTAKHTDVAITYLCEAFSGALQINEEGVSFKYVTPDEVMAMARIGDVHDGLVGGIITSTGGVPRHIQMCLHYFTRVCPNEFYQERARAYCKELGIPA